ncbi:hypothetical protein SAMN06298221_10213 [Sphaerochaeta associata]|uniref:Uncharacterized protein n=1 Tax=Sphaerochaeta associata TaxID=1129264 RepID=A0ABY4D858_9SPIR|nr:hypothetical protein [Sphaerochaeta associata]UOM50468.1 hypothetical protein MUG09_12975 [Sphaerochaeta associata]SMP41562.1 hypothetical protein SAMN06298221_10213 [Sphaerochaeta associata]
MERYHQYLIEGAEQRIQYFLKYQTVNVNDRNFGGIGMYEKNYPQAKSTIYRMTPALCCYVNPTSSYFENQELLERIYLALRYIMSKQRESGCFDLENCNFDSAPDTAFCVKRLLPLYRIVEGYPALNTESVLVMLRQIIEKALEGISNGGFHTPNHRWAIASILADGSKLLDMPKYMDKAKEYLAEGIDCNEFGEYSERSAITYNAVNNAAMLTLYQATGDEKFLDYVRRNLKMMLTYMEDDGSIFSENSTRQDKGAKAYGRDYFYQFLYVAARDTDPIYGKAAKRILDDNKRMNLRKAPDCLHYIMLDEKMYNYTFTDSGFLDSYEKHYKSSGLVRFKQGKMSYSLVENSPKALFFNTGSFGFYLRGSIGYFDKRHILLNELSRTQDGYKSTFHADGWYYLPLKKVDREIINFFEVDNSQRDKIIKNTIDIDIEVINRQNGFDISFTSKGIDEVSVLLEWVIPEGCEVENDAFYCISQPGGAIMVRQGYVKVRNGNDSFSFGPMGVSKYIMKGNYGSEARSESSFTLCTVMTTPFKRIFKVRSL